MISEWNILQTNLHRARQQDYQVAVLPTAAVEPHNLHLPMGQDVLHTTHVGRICCEDAWKKGAKVLLLPALPYGVDCNLMDFPLAIHVRQNTLDSMVTDIAESLFHHGIRKFVILNGHGGNDFKPLVRQLQCELDLHLFICNWWKVGQDRYKEIFEKEDDHAGELETSVALHLYPDLVESEKAASGKTIPFRFEALREGWVETSRRFGRLNDHCAAGEPDAASAAKGARYLQLVTGRITQFLVDLSASEIDTHFPHESV